MPTAGYSVLRILWYAIIYFRPPCQLFFEHFWLKVKTSQKNLRHVGFLSIQRQRVRVPCSKFLLLGEDQLLALFRLGLESTCWPSLSGGGYQKEQYLLRQQLRKLTSGLFVEVLCNRIRWPAPCYVPKHLWEGPLSPRTTLGEAGSQKVINQKLVRNKPIA